MVLPSWRPSPTRRHRWYQWKNLPLIDSAVDPRRCCTCHQTCRLPILLQFPPLPLTNYYCPGYEDFGFGQKLSDYHLLRLNAPPSAFHRCHQYRPTFSSFDRPDCRFRIHFQELVRRSSPLLVNLGPTPSWSCVFGRMFRNN